MPRSGAPPVPVDGALLRGFAFTCRPDCGLCCFTSPAVTPSEKARLLARDPSTPIEEPTHHRDEGLDHIAARPEGGACFFLSESRCRCHEVRPFPCQVFPVHTTLNRRAQASLVLSCPGIDLSSLNSRRGSGPGPARPQGLEGELSAVAAEVSAPEVADRLARAATRWERTLRRVRRAEPRLDLDAVVHALAKDPPLPQDEDFPATPPPDETEPRELLPFFFEEGQGILAFRAVAGGWEALPLRADGASEEALGVFPVGLSVPRADGPGTEMLRSYLAYVAQRDVFLDVVLREWESEPERPVQEVAELLLRDLGAQVLERAQFRALLRGRLTQPLTREDVERGVRATDMDFLDQVGRGETL